MNVNNRKANMKRERKAKIRLILNRFLAIIIYNNSNSKKKFLINNVV